MRLLINRMSGNSVLGDLSKMQPGGKITVEAHGLIAIDELWSSAFVSLENATNGRHPLFLYNPHNWTILLRSETDKIHAEGLRLKRRPVFLSIGSRTDLDRETIKMAVQGDIRCSLGSVIKGPHYVAVLDDYLFVVKLSKMGTAFIDQIFRENPSINKAASEIERIASKVTGKIIIERSRARSDEFKRKVSREFYIPKQWRDF